MTSCSRAPGGELFRMEGAELYVVVEGEESTVMQRGEFLLLLVKHACSPLAAVVAMVGDMQWPVGKDSLVVKNTDSRYSFALPATLNFALTFDPPPPPHLQLQLDSLLRQYSTFMPLQAGTDERKHATSARNAQAEGRMPFLMRDMKTVSPKLAQKMQQARRMSAVEKLFARTVEKGAINVSTHVRMLEADVSGDGQGDRELSVASVDAVAKVVEAVEAAGKTLLGRRQMVSTDWIQRKCGKEQGSMDTEGIETVGNLVTSSWTLNKMGLGMLFRTIASIQSRSSTISSDSQSSLGMDVSCGLQLSPPGSLPSTSSKVPAVLSNLEADSTSALQAEQLKLPLTPSPHTSVDNTSQAQAAGVMSSSFIDTTRAQPVNRIVTALEGALRPLPLPPRFCGAALPPPRLNGIIPTASLAAPGGMTPSSFHLYRTPPRGVQLSTAQAAGISNVPPSLLPWPLRPPPRPPHRPNI